MSDEQTESVLKRMTRAGQPAPDIAPMSTRKAFRLAVLKAGDKCNGLVLTLVGLKEQRYALDAMLEELADTGLYILLSAPPQDQGFVCIDAALLGGLIEMQTMGRILPGEVVERPPTATDAMMCAPFIDGLLAEFEDALIDLPDWLWASGFRSGGKLAGPRPLGLILEDVPFRLFRLSIDMGMGARTGEMILCFPSEAREARTAEGQDRVAAAPSWSDLIRASVAEAQVALRVVMDRQSLPLVRIEALAPGDVIEVPREGLHEARLETEDGRNLATGRVGQINGHRAILLEGATAAPAAATVTAAPPEMAPVPHAPALSHASEPPAAMPPEMPTADTAAPQTDLPEPPPPESAPVSSDEAEVAPPG